MSRLLDDWKIGEGHDLLARGLRDPRHRQHGHRLRRSTGVSSDAAVPARASLLEGLYYVVGLVSLGLGWYFNVRYVHEYGHTASYVNYTKALFSNWAADSAAQDYIIVNLVLLPLWTITDGRRRGLRIPWIFFVMSLFTSLAFSMAIYLAFVERQIRYNRELRPNPSTS